MGIFEAEPSFVNSPFWNDDFKMLSNLVRLKIPFQVVKICASFLIDHVVIFPLLKRYLKESGRVERLFPSNMLSVSHIDFSW